MCDQLSEFEENRAMNEIYKHDDIIRQEKEKKKLKQAKIKQKKKP